jgi:hypothetical protein
MHQIDNPFEIFEFLRTIRLCVSNHTLELRGGLCYLCVMELTIGIFYEFGTNWSLKYSNSNITVHCNVAAYEISYKIRGMRVNEIEVN